MHLFLALSLCVFLVIAVPVSVSNIYNKKNSVLYHFVLVCIISYIRLYRGRIKDFASFKSELLGVLGDPQTLALIFN